VLKSLSKIWKTVQENILKNDPFHIFLYFSQKDTISMVPCQQLKKVFLGMKTREVILFLKGDILNLMIQIRI
jgi:hypothetical protein